LRPFCPRECVEPVQGLIKSVLVKKNQRIERLILSAGGDISLDRQMFKK
jgi:hypothetical protein